MLPNNEWSLSERLERALLAIKRVYASTFSQHAKAYLRATPYRLEEEKMAVLLQRIVGSARGGRFYPDISGVARSRNFYPTHPLESRDGIVAVALGMGRTIVDGGACLRFSPKHPPHILQLTSVADALDTTQKDFWALALEGGAKDGPMREDAFDLSLAEADGGPRGGRVHLLTGERRDLRRAVAAGPRRRDLRAHSSSTDAFPRRGHRHPRWRPGRRGVGDSRGVRVRGEPGV